MQARLCCNAGAVYIEAFRSHATTFYFNWLDHVLTYRAAPLSYNRAEPIEIMTKLAWRRGAR
jgi:hypothetical protein